MHSYIPVFLLVLGCGSSTPLDKPNPVPTWYIEEPNEDTPKTGAPQDTPKTGAPEDTPPPVAPIEAGAGEAPSNNTVDAESAGSKDVGKKPESKRKAVGESQ